MGMKEIMNLTLGNMLCRGSRNLFKGYHLCAGKLDSFFKKLWTRDPEILCGILKLHTRVQNLETDNPVR